MVSCSVVSDSVRTHGLWPIRLLCPWDSPGKNTGVGCHSFLQGIFPTQGSNASLPHSKWTLSEPPRKPHFLLCYLNYDPCLPDKSPACRILLPACSSLQPCPTLCDPMNCSLPGSSVHGILQARILEWVAMSFSRWSSWPRDWPSVFCLLHWQVGSLTTSATWNAPNLQTLGACKDCPLHSMSTVCLHHLFGA